MDETQQRSSQVVWVVEILRADDDESRLSHVVGLFGCPPDCSYRRFKYLLAIALRHPPRKILISRPDNAPAPWDPPSLPPALLLFTTSDDPSIVWNKYSVRTLPCCSEECPVCMAKACDRASLPCGHLFCGTCVPLLDACAICRTPIKRASAITSLHDFPDLSKRDWRIGSQPFSIFSWVAHRAQTPLWA